MASFNIESRCNPLIIASVVLASVTLSIVNPPGEDRPGPGVRQRSTFIAFES